MSVCLMASHPNCAAVYCGWALSGLARPSRIRWPSQQLLLVAMANWDSDGLHSGLCRSDCGSALGRQCLPADSAGTVAGPAAAQALLHMSRATPTCRKWGILRAAHVEVTRHVCGKAQAPVTDVCWPALCLGSLDCVAARPCPYLPSFCALATLHVAKLYLKGQEGLFPGPALTDPQSLADPAPTMLLPDWPICQRSRAAC